jgi:phosphoribosylamine---glycine ligase
VAPGNPGTVWRGEHGRASCDNIPIQAGDHHGLLRFAKEKNIDLTVVGPEGPLAEGVVDLFNHAGCPIFGPSREAAQLEASKAFAKEFMRQFNIPTAESLSFTDYHEAQAYLATIESGTTNGVVIKASGLAAGKGVIVCDRIGAAQIAIEEIMHQRIFGTAGDVVIIEEKLVGREVSVLAFCDGHTAVPLVPARDHKRVGNNDTGPNTGGMGAFAPVPDVDEAWLAEVVEKVLNTAVRGMATRGTPYKGILYAGLMLTAEGMKVLEFNCRFGDPETQVVLPLLENDLAAVMMACIDGRLYSQPISIKPQACATVVLAAEGYPGAYATGAPISGIAKAEKEAGVMVFQAGTAVNAHNQLVTNGGRVLAVTAVGADLPAATTRAYEGVAHIHFPGAHYRTDIGG